MKLLTLFGIWVTVSSGVLASPTASLVTSHAQMIEMAQRLLSDDQTDVKDSFSKVWEYVPYFFDVHVKLRSESCNSPTNSAIPKFGWNYSIGLLPSYNQHSKKYELEFYLRALLEALHEAVDNGEKAVMKVIVYFLAWHEEDGQNKLEPINSFEPINLNLQRVSGWPDGDVASLRLWALGFLILPRLAKIAEEKKQLEFFLPLVQGSPFAQSYDPLQYTLDKPCKLHDEAMVPVEVEQLYKVFEAEFLQSILPASLLATPPELII
ncbi:hypothetical protein IWQ61_000285 [Dispira simplex]|nr:hypothetical protein IWQ61_000285 [Dispira simplex]